jgi:hypothetical protein
VTAQGGHHAARGRWGKIQFGGEAGCRLAPVVGDHGLQEIKRPVESLIATGLMRGLHVLTIWAILE